MSISNILKIAFSKPHLENFENLYLLKNNHTEVIKVVDRKISKTAFVTLSIATLGIAWLVYDLYSAYRKVKVIDKSHLNISHIITPQPINQKSITFALSGGRLGDNLMTFLAAYNLAFRNHLPFYYTPFADSEKFYLSDQLDPVESYRFKSKVSVKDFASLKKAEEIQGESSTLITVAPFADVRPDWDYPGFKEAVRELIKPKKNLDLVSIPVDKIGIALHMRTGGDLIQMLRNGGFLLNFLL